eukprot:CAMPEP_0194506898 /NCGR_PEP_ID=MMETSP0253-20130528/35516_1 /TAXON_ID=2966 /ORGANISM="Noctiluca scintillans" /LENGTH=88 /DNA_ID=CAMNT_0039349693 /DNA_START=35 /DNA_END=298 /DNA_ORIENTATION=+
MLSPVVPSNRTDDEEVLSTETDDVSILSWIASFVDGAFVSLFSKIGLFVGRYPWRVIGACCVWTLFCASGFSQMTTEGRSEELWSPTD